MGNDLTVAEVAKRLKLPGRHRVSKNLYLQVKASGSASWLFRYMLNGNPDPDRSSRSKGDHGHWMGLGSYDAFGLAEARQRALEARQHLADKHDPLDNRRERITADKIEAAKSLTFGECARQYVAAHAPSWKNGKHAAQWRATFGLWTDDAGTNTRRKRTVKSATATATAIINELPIGKIDTALAIKVLEPIWSRTPETASRVRQRCEQVVAWASAQKFREDTNPFAWRGHLDKLLPKPSRVKRVRHHPALPYAETPKFMVELRANNFVSARALEFMLLTATRTGEVVGATWDEIDVAEKVWTVPPERMKSGNEHKVPLSERPLEILSRLPREDGNPHVFIGGRKGRSLSNMAMLELMKGMRPGYVPHGFRATFRTWTAERTNYPHIVCELALGHTQSDALMRAYQRGDLFQKRRRLMLDWAKFCASPAAKEAGSNVTPMRRREKVS